MIPDINPLLNILLLRFMASLGTSLGGLNAVIHKPGRRVLCQILEKAGFYPLCVEDTETHYVVSAQVRPGATA